MKIVNLTVLNFKTLCDFHITFSPHLTAICGPNDSGKSNIVKALRILFEAEDEFPREYMDASVKDHFPVWDDTVLDKRVIKLEATLSIDNQNDVAIHQVVSKQLSLEEPEDELELTISIHYSHQGQKISVTCGSKSSDSLEAEQIVKALRATGPLLYHNSTSLEGSYRRGGDFSGLLYQVSPDYQKLQSEVQSYVDTRLKKQIKLHQKELSELLGRLESKYNIGLATPKFNFNYLPFNITLGEKGVSVPLDDWGSGTQNRTQILLQLFRARQISQSEASASKVTPILVIEEPECFLHPSAQAEFGRVLRDLAEEFQVQVVITTHSPYLLSHKNPSSNVLLKREVVKKIKHQTCVETVDDQLWAKPFSLALGVAGEELVPWKNLFFAGSDSILLVEGMIDKEYFELLRDPAHGNNRIEFDGEIFTYDGWSSLTNNLLLKFIKNKYRRVLITFDLDALANVERHMTSLQLKRDQDYLPMGVDSAGRRSIEGYLPDEIVNKVNAANIHLVRALSSDNKEEVKQAKQELKGKYLAEFKASANVADGHFNAFYPIAKKLNKLLARE
jgi:energy-coupling factor transporter ATP-binding protein EcfA2